MSITFTQYLMPDGRRRQTLIDRPQDIEDLAASLALVGVRFESELLSDYATVSLTAEIDDREGETLTLAHEIVRNGPGVPGAVDRLVRSAAEKIKESSL